MKEVKRRIVQDIVVERSSKELFILTPYRLVLLNAIILSINGAFGRFTIYVGLAVGLDKSTFDGLNLVLLFLRF